MNNIHQLFIIIQNEKGRLYFEKFKKDSVVIDVEQGFQPADRQGMLKKYDGCEHNLMGTGMGTGTGTSSPFWNVIGVAVMNSGLIKLLHLGIAKMQLEVVP